ncbi:hypothetical protein LWI29_028321 [Acer saccharum]|uniref:CCHC-type domain-containing protein n=1 Tax=Acer saccharum TaxID=4024 RepID=A0AA39RU31_ACESA|nr:hypothetical protein LWI29_028321 [Acer saccharum]
MPITIHGGNRTQLQVVEQLRRLHPPSFEGTMNPLYVKEWHQELEKVFTFINYTDDQKVACSMFILKDIRKHVRVLGLMTYVDVLQKAQILAKKDEITINTKLKEKVHSPPQKKQWNKNFQCKSDYRNRGQKRQRGDDAETKKLPLYKTCGKKHGGICFRKVGACFKCGKPGHFFQNCPKIKKDTGAQRKDQKT